MINGNIFIALAENTSIPKNIDRKLLFDVFIARSSYSIYKPPHQNLQRRTAAFVFNKLIPLLTPTLP